MMIQKLSRSSLIVLICCFFSHPLFALVMKGKVYDELTQKPLSGVNIINLNTDMVFQTDSTGLFTINVEKGQTIKFQRHNYQEATIRISNASLPYYSIGLQKEAYELPEVTIKGHNYHIDSIENAKTYEWALDYYKLTGLDVIQHPFDALSKRNREIWAFQKRYHYFEEQKFIDYVFNDKLITKISGLQGEALNA